MPVTLNRSKIVMNGVIVVNPFTPSSSGINLVQSSFSGSTSNPSTPTITFTAGTPTNGNQLILAIVSDTTVSSVSGSWTLIDSAVDFTGTYLYRRIAGASEPTVVTITLAGIASCNLGLMEYNTVNTLDVHDPNTAQGTASVICGPTTTTTAANELVVALAGVSNGGTTPPTVTAWNNGFVQLAGVTSSGIGTPIGLYLATKIISAVGTQTTTATLSTAGSANNSGIIATFK